MAVSGILTGRMADSRGMSSHPSLAEQLAELRREFAVRQRVYPRWVSTKRMTQDEATHSLACLQAAIASLEALAGSRALMRELEEVAASLRQLGEETD